MKNCDTCQQFEPPHVSLKVELPTKEVDLILGDEFTMDIMSLHGKSVINIVDSAKRFNAATFLDSNGEIYGQEVHGI